MSQASTVPSTVSPDTLPMTGYDREQLAGYIRRQLGEPVWVVELTQQQILDAIQDALSLFSMWVPRVRVGNVVLRRNQFSYLQGESVGMGITQICFVEPNPVPTEIFYSLKMGTF